MVLVLAAACDEPATAGDAAIVADAPAVDAADDRVEDPCPPAVACPSTAGVVRGAGLVPIDRCAFPLAPVTPATDPAAIIDALADALPVVAMDDVAADANRVAVPVSTVPGTAPGIRSAFTWNAGDEAVAYWIPQGVTGSFDGTPSATARRIVLVTWYYEREADPPSTVEKGVRIAVVDATNPADVRYRFALLVEPTGTAAEPSFKSVAVHAGGVAWVGDRLYIPQTSTGFRVFDLSHILRVDSLDDRIGRDANGSFAAHGYQYVIPQSERISVANACNSVFSFAALDRTSTPPSLVSGEYDADSVAGRIYRWPLAANGALQLTTRDRIVPSAAYAMGESHVQGGLAHDDTWWLSSSRPAGGAGELVRVRESTASTRLGWSDSPEDLAYDPQADAVWSLSEAVDARYVFSVARAAIAP